jgi:hypothetical protein
MNEEMGLLSSAPVTPSLALSIESGNQTFYFPNINGMTDCHSERPDSSPADSSGDLNSDPPAHTPQQSGVVLQLQLPLTAPTASSP